jgi:hypothetical protein
MSTATVSVAIDRLVLNAPIGGFETGHARAEFARLVAAALEGLIGARGVPPGLAGMGAVGRVTASPIVLGGELAALAQGLAESLYAGLTA